MEKIILICCLIFAAMCVIGVFICNTSFGQQLMVKVKGRADETMRRDASTPEGARDYYNAAIKEKEDIRSRVAIAFSEICGKLDSAQKDLYQANKDLMKFNQQINSCLDVNDEDGAMAYSTKAITVEKKIESLKEVIEELKQAKSHQKELLDQTDTDLQKLKEEKEQVVFELEANQQIIELHQSMNNMTINNETDRMLERVREGARKTKEQAEGSRIAYNSSSQAADRRLEASERERDARQRLEEMKRKRGAK